KQSRCVRNDAFSPSGIASSRLAWSMQLLAMTRSCIFVKKINTMKSKHFILYGIIISTTIALASIVTLHAQSNENDVLTSSRQNAITRTVAIASAAVVGI